MMNNGWAFPGDSPMARMRTLALAYRAIGVTSESPATRAQCEQLDALAARFGEKWLTPHEVAYSDDDYIDREDVAVLLAIKLNSVSKLAKRRNLKTYPVAGDKRRKQYRAGDIYLLAA